MTKTAGDPSKTKHIRGSNRSVTTHIVATSTINTEYVRTFHAYSRPSLLMLTLFVPLRFPYVMQSCKRLRVDVPVPSRGGRSPKQGQRSPNPAYLHRVSIITMRAQGQRGSVNVCFSCPPFPARPPFIFKCACLNMHGVHFGKVFNTLRC